MINCPKCKAEIDPDSRYCDQCGQEILYCTACGRPGKGQRCTTCGAPMRRLDDEQPDATAPSQPTQVTTARESAIAAAIGANYRSHLPQLFLVNDNLHLRLPATDGAVIGRRAGIYSQFLASCNYISGTHAQLHYTPDSGWCIEDKASSNGTFVNGNRLTPGHSQPLHNRDLVQLANIEFRVEIPQQ